MTATLAKTPLHDWHANHNGRMVDFAGWSMPVQYGSIVAEHQATRSACGLFDVSHMGRLRFVGSWAAAFLDSVVTRRMTDLPVGQIRYGLVTNDAGGILDDVLVYHLAAPVDISPGDPNDDTHYIMVVNAGNREKIVGWLTERLAGRDDVRMEDLTQIFSMIAVQGPLAQQLLQPLVDDDLSNLAYYHGRYMPMKAGWPAIVSRTGYTGEDGFELIVLENGVRNAWDSILAAGRDAGAMACGLGCRDTLRLEAAMPLYGHELNEQITPLEAGLKFAVDLEGRSFPGHDVLIRQATEPTARVRVGLEITGKRVPREHFTIWSDGRTVGEVTSGTFSPTLDRPIAMGYVERAVSAVGSELMVDIRGTPTPARVVKLPFYKRNRNG